MKLFALLHILILLLFCANEIYSLHKNNTLLSLSNTTNKNINITEQRTNKTKGNLKNPIKTNTTATFMSYIPEIYQFKTESKRNRLYAADYYSSIRNISLYISKENECTIFVNDTITYNNISPSSFVEHMLLHNKNCKSSHK